MKCDGAPEPAADGGREWTSLAAVRMSIVPGNFNANAFREAVKRAVNEAAGEIQVELITA